MYTLAIVCLIGCAEIRCIIRRFVLTPASQRLGVVDKFGPACRADLIVQAQLRVRAAADDLADPAHIVGIVIAPDTAEISRDPSFKLLIRQGFQGGLQAVDFVKLFVGAVTCPECCDHNSYRFSAVEGRF